VAVGNFSIKKTWEPQVNTKIAGVDGYIYIFKLAIVLTQPIWVFKVGVNRSKTIAHFFFTLFRGFTPWTTPGGGHAMA